MRHTSIMVNLSRRASQPYEVAHRAASWSGTVDPVRAEVLECSSMSESLLAAMHAARCIIGAPWTG